MMLDVKNISALVEADRDSGELAKNICPAIFAYSSGPYSGVIEQINQATNERRLGNFVDGKFVPLG